MFNNGPPLWLVLTLSLGFLLLELFIGLPVSTYTYADLWRSFPASLPAACNSAVQLSAISALPNSGPCQLCFAWNPHSLCCLHCTCRQKVRAMVGLSLFFLKIRLQCLFSNVENGYLMCSVHFFSCLWLECKFGNS